MKSSHKRQHGKLDVIAFHPNERPKNWRRDCGQGYLQLPWNGSWAKGLGLKIVLRVIVGNRIDSWEQDSVLQTIACPLVI